jgi:MSHA biogenesis protein MshO
MSHPILQRRRARGFTLVEAVLTIVIIGILAGMVAVFIRAPVLSYRDTVERADLTDQADLALRRIARDIRLALPNSVRVSAAGDHLELLLTRSGARYLSLDEGAAPSAVLSFDNPDSASFAAVGMPGTFAQVRRGDYVVVYNLGYEPANAYALGATGISACPPKAGESVTGAGNIACISAAPASASQTINGQTVPAATVTLAGNPFARQDIPMTSPEQRFHVVSGPVSFYCAPMADGRLALWRAWGYDIPAAQSVPTTGQRAPIAAGLSSCNGLFTYDTNAALQRTGLVVLRLDLRGRSDSNASIRLVHQVHVDNTP